MPKGQRPPHAARRASFARAERLRREADDTPRKRAAPARSERSPKQEARPRPARTISRERRPPPLSRVQERLERSREASARRYHARLQEQTRTRFNDHAERRRDTGRRAEHDRKREVLQEKVRRIEDNRRRSVKRHHERKREETRRAFTRAAEDRKAQQLAERQKELQRRAAAEIEREQKRRADDHKAEHRRQADGMRERHKVERNSYRVNESTAMERHHHAIKGIDRREDERLHDFDGRRRGLVGRVAELVPGRRAENDRQREDIKRGFEAERLTKHRDFEAYKERAFDREQKSRLDQARELKMLRELHRDERGSFGREQADARPRLIEQRAHVLERADRAHEQQREHTRAEPARERTGEPGRPMSYFTDAASGHARETSTEARDLNRDEQREMVRPTPEFGRA